jgi:hypothetical protein
LLKKTPQPDKYWFFVFFSYSPIGAAIRPLLDSLGGGPRNTPAPLNPASDLGILSFLAPQNFSQQFAQNTSQDIELNTEALW